ncbi:MAG: hypothetical protein RTU63_03410 [Candidatus Thorarchaeota archaeon]
MVKKPHRVKSLLIVSLALTSLVFAGLLLPAVTANPLIAQTSTYTTFLGGTMGEDATKVSFDNDGNTILIGQTPSDDFPVTTNALQSEYGGGNWDGFVAKFSTSGDLLYSTYLGGNAYEHVTSVNVDSGNNIVLAGTTQSSDFPTTPSGLDVTHNGETDGFIMKIAPNGTLLYSSFFGGAGNDWIYGIQFDASENYMFSGWTTSTGLGTAGTLNPNPIGGIDSFIARVSADGSTVQMCSYLGGTSTERISCVDIDSEYNFVLAGTTESSDYPVTGDTYQSGDSGGTDAVLTKVAHNGSTLIFSTIIGGHFDDRGLSVSVDSTDSIIIAGYANSDDIPTHNALQGSFGGGDADIYVAKFNSTYSLDFLTYLGGNGTDYCWEVVTDHQDNIIVAGRTGSTNYPAHDGLNDTYQGSMDAVATKYSPDGQSILVSSFIGGSGSDIGEGAAVDGTGHIVITGRTLSSDFPVSEGTYQDEIGGLSDVFVCHTAFDVPTTTSTNTTTSSTDTGGSPLDTTTLLIIGVGGIGIVIVLVVMLKRK